MKIEVDQNIFAELIKPSHAPLIFEMVDINRDHLRQWLPFVDRMQDVSFAENFVKGTISRNQTGTEFAFIIFYEDTPVGRIGIYKIDHLNKSGEIGYWLIPAAQSKGIIQKSANALIDYSFDHLGLHRIEIRCATENHKSQSIPEKLGFTKEGIIRDGEWLGDRFTDLVLYSLLKKDKS
ncbi:MAG: GNAT family N-acetyltransferase [Saprospiraceae bacterium]|jgi:ribosomal-protein-serine acetyltransferase|nr:GNAT family N-acetyltransferase [Saprospiraceae bacterium]